jgi:hypothetical protein
MSCPVAKSSFLPSSKAGVLLTSKVTTRSDGVCNSCVIPAARTRGSNDLRLQSERSRCLARTGLGGWPTLSIIENLRGLPHPSARGWRRMGVFRGPSLRREAGPNVCCTSAGWPALAGFARVGLLLNRLSQFPFGNPRPPARLSASATPQARPAKNSLGIPQVTWAYLVDSKDSGFQNFSAHITKLLDG